MADGIVPTGIVPSGASLPNTNLARFLNASTSAFFFGEAFLGVFARETLDSGLLTRPFLERALFIDEFLPIMLPLRDRDCARAREVCDAIRSEC